MRTTPFIGDRSLRRVRLWLEKPGIGGMAAASIRGERRDVRPECVRSAFATDQKQILAVTAPSSRIPQDRAERSGTTAPMSGGHVEAAEGPTSGRGAIRTRGLSHAKGVIYQLIYAPAVAGHAF